MLDGSESQRLTCLPRVVSRCQRLVGVPGHNIATRVGVLVCSQAVRGLGRLGKVEEETGLGSLLLVVAVMPMSELLVCE